MRTKRAIIPPDRGGLSTEQRLAASARLDTLSTRRLLELINAQDAIVAAAVRRAAPAIARLVDAVVEAFRNGGRLIYLGAGTSGRLGVLDASECPPTYHSAPSMVVGIIAGGDAALRKSSEGAEDDPDGARAELSRLKVGKGDVLVGIAAGGTTPYVWGGLRYAKQRGATTAILACVRGPRAAGHNRKRSGRRGPAREDLPPDHVIELLVGPEVITGSTRMKAGTATKLALNMITAASMVRIGKTWGDLMVDLRATNDKLVDRAARIIVGQTGMSRPEAIALLQRAGGRVKVALVMARCGLSARQARQRIEEHGGRLRPILGAPR